MGSRGESQFAPGCKMVWVCVTQMRSGFFVFVHCIAGVCKTGYLKVRLQFQISLPWAYDYSIWLTLMITRSWCSTDVTADMRVLRGESQIVIATVVQRLLLLFGQLW